MNNIRNFVIIAHIDHGKSTLADRFLELTQSVEKRHMKAQYLDQMDLERERGITIKMQPVTMNYSLLNIQYQLNLIDTPGHVDFSYEVSRSLAAVEGAILLVDATKGIQAQTLAHLRVALEQGLTIIPVINKIDLAQGQVKETEEGILALLMSFNITFEKVYKISAKTGEGVEELLEAVINKIPSPKSKIQKSQITEQSFTKALIFDSIYDDYKGIISYVRIFEGEIKIGDEILFMASGSNSKVKEVGIFKPQLEKRESLESGNIGYIVSGVKSVESAPIGDTITLKYKKAEEPIGGYKNPQPVVFSTIYTAEDANYEEMKLAFDKLKLNDASLYFEPELSPILGRGLRVGFLGMLHMEIVLERLRREYNLDLVVTSPSVSYKLLLKNSKRLDVFNPSQYPDPSVIESVSEPWVLLKLITPPDYMNNIMNLLKGMRGTYRNTDYLGSERMQISYEVPLSEIIEDFYNSLKNTTSGYASMAYEILDYRVTEIVKLDILLAGDEMSALSRLVVKEKAEKEARRLVERIKEVLPRQLFVVAIQATVGGKIIARETKSAARKDVTGYLYGGDITRKKKLLEKQKKGKKRMAKHGKVNIDPETMMRIFNE